MASPNPSFFQRLRRLFRFTSAEEGKEKAPKGQEKPNANGRIYGESVLKSAWLSAYKSQKMQTFIQHEYMSPMTSTSSFVPNDCDEPAEVFLDADGEIKLPLERKIAYDFCNLDRWFMPDCVPGIVSRVDITHCSDRPILPCPDGVRPLKIITVLYANDTYIHLAPRHIFYIEPDDDYYSAVVSHFAKRGIDYIRDMDINSKNWDNWVKTFGTTNGFRNTKTGISGVGSNRRGNPNPTIVVGPGPKIEPIYTSTEIDKAKYWSP